MDIALFFCSHFCEIMVLGEVTNSRELPIYYVFVYGFNRLLRLCWISGERYNEWNPAKRQMRAFCLKYSNVNGKQFRGFCNGIGSFFLRISSISELSSRGGWLRLIMIAHRIP